ncbi:MAG: sigma-70 family RNA polymerase sigma factor [Mariniblastus sp.]
MATVIETKEATVLITDNELLGRYLNKKDSSAFEELVRRHSKLVMGVCQNMLFHRHDAEDAFQATFLILSRKASKLIHHGSVAGWLYQTAMRNCLQVRRRKGRARETEMIEEPVGSNEPWQTIADAQERDRIYQEINRLPKRYRDVIVLCHLEGHTRNEAAEFLDWTEAAVKAALARGRNLLRRRLIRSGLMTSVALATMGAATVNAQSAVTDHLIASALQHCQNITPTVSVGSSPQFVRTLSNQGILSMHSVTLVKAISLAATIVFAVSIPFAMLAAQSTVASRGTEVVATLDEPPVAKGDLRTSVEVGEPAVPTAKLNSATDEIKSDQTVKFSLVGDSSSSATTKVIGGNDDWVSDDKRFKIENSQEYWELMLQAHESRARVSEANNRLPNQSTTAKLTSLAELYESRAKVVEARLNLERIKFESRRKNLVEPPAEVAISKAASNSQPNSPRKKGDRAVGFSIVSPEVSQPPLVELARYVQVIEKACKLYKLNCGTFPKSLDSLTQCPSNMSPNRWGGPYMEDAKAFDDFKRSVKYSVDETNDKVTLDWMGKGMKPSEERLGSDPRNLSNKQTQLPKETSFVPPASTTVVKPGEVLLVESMVDESLNRRVVVQADNTIMLPLVGVVLVHKKTTMEISKILNGKYAGYVASPDIFVVRESASTPLKR